MQNRLTHVVSISFILFSFVLSVYLYPTLPESVASHWNIDGVADGYMSKFWGIFLVPFLMLLMYLFYIVIPKIDPMAKNIQAFRAEFNLFWVGLFTFFFYIYSLIIAWNVGIRFDFSYAMAPAMGAFFYLIGSIMTKAKRNYFMGIKTPWTLASDIVWDKTHRLGGSLFKWSGILILVSALFGGKPAFFTTIISTVLSAVISIIYSYLIFKKLEKNHG